MDPKIKKIAIEYNKLLLILIYKVDHINLNKVNLLQKIKKVKMYKQICM